MSTAPRLGPLQTKVGIGRMALLVATLLCAPTIGRAESGKASTPAMVASVDEPLEGRVVYANRCRICHGPNMVTPGGAVFDLRRFPLEDRERFDRSVLQGRGAMPAWQGVLTTAELDALWTYVQTRGR